MPRPAERLLQVVRVDLRAAVNEGHLRRRDQDVHGTSAPHQGVAIRA